MWCSGNANDRYELTGFVPPVTSDRYMTGLVAWQTDDDGDSWLLLKDAKAFSLMAGVDIAAGNCAVSPSGTVVA